MTVKLSGTVESALSYAVRMGIPQKGTFGYFWILSGEDGFTLASGVSLSRRRAKRHLKKAAAEIRKAAYPERFEL